MTRQRSGCSCTGCHRSKRSTVLACTLRDQDISHSSREPNDRPTDDSPWAMRGALEAKVWAWEESEVKNMTLATKEESMVLVAADGRLEVTAMREAEVCAARSLGSRSRARRHRTPIRLHRRRNRRPYRNYRCLCRQNSRQILCNSRDIRRVANNRTNNRSRARIMQPYACNRKKVDTYLCSVWGRLDNRESSSLNQIVLVQG